MAQTTRQAEIWERQSARAHGVRAQSGAYPWQERRRGCRSVARALPVSDDLGAGEAGLGAGVGAAGLGAAGLGADGVDAATGAVCCCDALALENAGAAEDTGCGSADAAARADGECSSC